MSKVYALAKMAFIKGQLAWANDGAGTLKIQPVDTSYVVSDAHEFLTDIPDATKVGSPVILATPTVTNTTGNTVAVDTDDAYWSVIPVGDEIKGFIIYKDTGTPATSRVIYYGDTGTGIPFIPSGAEYTLEFSNGVHRIFSW